MCIVYYSNILYIYIYNIYMCMSSFQIQVNTRTNSPRQPLPRQSRRLILLDSAELRPAVLLEIIRAQAHCLTMVVLAHLEVRLAEPCKKSMPTATDGKGLKPPGPVTL